MKLVKCTHVLPIVYTVYTLVLMCTIVMVLRTLFTFTAMCLILREGDDNSRIFCLFIGRYCKCSWAGVGRTSYVLLVRTVSVLGLE